jgi:hypothetical protein
MPGTQHCGANDGNREIVDKIEAQRAHKHGLLKAPVDASGDVVGLVDWCATIRPVSQTNAGSYALAPLREIPHVTFAQH